MHYSVMKEESIKGLNLNEAGIYVDCTLGYAGHSSEILKRMKRGFLFAFDQDKDAISYSYQKLKSIGMVRKTNKDGAQKRRRYSGGNCTSPGLDGTICGERGIFITNVGICNGCIYLFC